MFEAYVLGWLDYADMGNVADVSEEYAACVVRIEVCILILKYFYMFFMSLSQWPHRLRH
jgi:hypothetical protein